jgi:hypothetical protein
MQAFLQVLSTVASPGLLVVIVLVLIMAFNKNNLIGQFIVALNLFTTPWIAILVIILGMAFDLQCKRYGLPGDAANQIIGAGIGLLTGRALANGNHDAQPNPIPPVNPAQPKL